MRSRSFLAVAGFLVVLALVAAGTFAYDASRDDTIAEGVTIAGIDVGGLDREQAQRRLEAELAAELRAPLRARYRDRRFTLTAKRARIAVDVEATVDEALAVTGSDNILTRTFRGLTGGRVEKDLDVEVTYDRKAVRQLVKRVRATVDRPARDADISISTAGVQAVKARTGVRVDAAALTRAVGRRLTSPTGRRSVRVKTRRTKPKVTTAELAKEYPAVIVVNRANFNLTLYEHLKPTLNYTVAIGAIGYDTPAGLYEIQNKAIDPVWTVPNSDWAGSLAGQTIPPGPENPLKARWMGIYNGAGIHGTDATYSLGSAASHGCVRMAIPDVEELYEHVDVGTPVYIG